MGVLRLLPRHAARKVGASAGSLAGLFAVRLRQVGEVNVNLALPSTTPERRSALLRVMFRRLGEQVAEFCQMTAYTPRYAQREVFRYKGLQHYLKAREKGGGVLVLTGHLGAWELSSFLHSLVGYPMGMVIRRLDNPLIDRFVNDVRCLHGNRVLHKDDFARGLLRAMHKGETVGILMDTNMTPPQGVFVPFFGVDACTASGLARVARRSGAAVLPGFLLWSDTEQRYVLHFGEELQLQRTSDEEADALANTQLFARVTEEYIRRYPEQWLWVHRRWKTRPAGQPSLYGQRPALVKRN